MNLKRMWEGYKSFNSGKLIRYYSNDMTEQEKMYLAVFMTYTQMTDKKILKKITYLLKIGKRTNKFDNEIQAMLMDCIKNGKSIFNQLDENLKESVLKMKTQREVMESE